MKWRSSDLALVLAVALAAVSVTGLARGGEQMLCQLERGDGDGWHYRTKIMPKPDARCWYVGERMKARDELYWAEAPTVAPVPMDRPPWEMEHRWNWIDSTGRSHQE